jgi:nitrogen fixation/metabolism regulation signal transduction histidine kinase
MIYAREKENVFEPVDLSRLVGETLTLLKVSVPKSAVLRIDLAGDLPLLGSETQIQQVVRW